MESHTQQFPVAVEGGPPVFKPTVERSFFPSQFKAVLHKTWAYLEELVDARQSLGIVKGRREATLDKCR